MYLLLLINLAPHVFCILILGFNSFDINVFVLFVFKNNIHEMICNYIIFLIPFTIAFVVPRESY